MARAIFKYTKEVLQKVSFDVNLFTKEVQKAVEILLPHEIIELRNFLLEIIETNPELEGSLAYLEVQP